MYHSIVTSTTSVAIQATSAGAAAKRVGERAGHVGVVTARVATADARTIPVRQDLGKMSAAEVEDSPLQDMAWPGEVVDGAPEAVQAECDRLVQLLGQDFPWPIWSSVTATANPSKLD
jgi:hypothetical protein